MSNWQIVHKRTIRVLLLSGIGVLLASSPAAAQIGMGGGAGGGGAGGGGAGGAGSAATSTNVYEQGLFGGLGGNVVGPTTANPLKGYYANPYSIGMPSQLSTTKSSGSSGSGATTGSAGNINSGTTNQKPSFGVAMYPSSTTTSGTSSAAGAGKSSGSSSFQSPGSSTYGSSGASSFGTSSSSGGLGSSSSSGVGSSGKATFGTSSGGGGSSSSASFGAGKALGSSGLGSGTMGSSGTSGGTVTSSGFTTMGLPKNPPYVAVMGSNLPLAPVPGPGSLQFKVAQVIQISSSLPSKGNMQVLTQGNTVILSGTVVNDHERNLAEAIIRLTPGVQNVTNNLVIGGAPPTGP